MRAGRGKVLRLEGKKEPAAAHETVSDRRNPVVSSDAGFTAAGSWLGGDGGRFEGGFSVRYFPLKVRNHVCGDKRCERPLGNELLHELDRGKNPEVWSEDALAVVLSGLRLLHVCAGKTLFSPLEHFFGSAEIAAQGIYLGDLGFGFRKV